MASNPAPLLTTAPSKHTISPPLPRGLEADLRAALSVLAMLHRGKGHVSVRIDLSPGKRASWELGIVGNGQERE